MSEEIILNTDDRAAKKVTVEGWVSRDGLFFGQDERTARYSGSTHVACRDCQKPTPKGWLVCNDCRGKAEIAKYEALERKPWDGLCMLAVYKDDRFFSDLEEAEEYAADIGCTLEDLRLVLCEPKYAHQLDPNDIYGEHLPEDVDVPDDIAEAFVALNEKIAACRKPLCWYQTDIALDLSEATDRGAKNG